MQTVYYSLLHLYILLLEIITVIKHPSLWKFFLYFQMEYLFFSPYYYASKGNQGNDTFGFTPLNTIHRIIKVARKNVTGNNNLLDLGSGDCRILFFLSIVYGYNCKGIEANEKFVNKALFINKMLKLNNLEILATDFMNVSWQNYAIIFIAWTTFSLEMISLINDKLVKEQAEGDLVITLSFPVEIEAYEVIFQGLFLFSWGRNKVFISRRLVK